MPAQSSSVRKQWTRIRFGVKFTGVWNEEEKRFQVEKAKADSFVKAHSDILDQPHHKRDEVPPKSLGGASGSFGRRWPTTSPSAVTCALAGGGARALSRSPRRPITRTPPRHPRARSPVRRRRATWSSTPRTTSMCARPSPSSPPSARSADAAIPSSLPAACSLLPRCSLAPRCPLPTPASGFPLPAFRPAAAPLSAAARDSGADSRLTRSARRVPRATPCDAPMRRAPLRRASSPPPRTRTHGRRLPLPRAALAPPSRRPRAARCRCCRCCGTRARTRATATARTVRRCG